MGSVHAKPSSSRMMKGQYRSRSSLVSVIIRGIMLALAASALIIYTLPSLKFFLFEVIPSLWSCSSDLFTPINLFVLLNLIILTILAMSHLHSTQLTASASSSRSSLQRPPTRGHNCTQETSDQTDGPAVNRSLSEAFKLAYQKSADLELISEVESANERINDQSTAYNKDEDRDNQAMNTGLMVMKEMIIETQLQEAVDNGENCADHQVEKRKAEPKSKKAAKEKSREAAESKKAEKVVQGNPLLPGCLLDDDSKICYNIDSLLSEEGSIFTRLQSRPLPSARFSSKKATKLSGLDRPLSPLKMSRPILKRGDTLDATWKAICESKRHSSPLTRPYSKHTRKVDPYEEIIEGVRVSSSSSPLSPIKQRSKIIMNSLNDKELAKAKRREPSMPQEELNAKVESFISRFNEQIRIQREKSLLDYMEMVGRGSS